MVKLGLQARLFRNIGDYAAPVWQHVGSCREMTLSLERAEAEIATRGNAGFRATAVALKDASVEAELAYAPPDGDVDALIAAMTGGTSLDLLVADGDGIGAQGLRADWIVQAIERGEPLEDAQRLRVTLKTDSQAHAPQWYTSTGMLVWAHYKEITVRPDNVNARLLDFPLHVPIEADADIGASARADGLDIRFTNADGTQELPFERESFTIINGNAEGRFWVKVPTIDPDSGATIRIYYGNPDATDAQNPADVWYAYLFVAHGGDLTPSYVRASRGSHARKADVGKPQEVSDGHLGDAQEFDTGASLDLGDIKPDCWTIELLYQGSSSPDGLLAHWGDLKSAVWTPEPGNPIRVDLGQDNWATWPVWRTATLCDGNWHHLAINVPGAGQTDINNALLFLDGTADPPELTGFGTAQQAKPGNLVLGALGQTEGAWGVFDEIRVYDWEPDTAWMEFAAQNMLNTDDYELTWGAEQ